MCLILADMIERIRALVLFKSLKKQADLAVGVADGAAHSDGGPGVDQLGDRTAPLQRAPPADGAGELHLHQQALLSEGHRDGRGAESCGGHARPDIYICSTVRKPSSEKSRRTEVGVVKLARLDPDCGAGAEVDAQADHVVQLEVGKGLREVTGARRDPDAPGDVLPGVPAPRTHLGLSGNSGKVHQQGQNNDCNEFLDDLFLPDKSRSQLTFTKVLTRSQNSGLTLPSTVKFHFNSRTRT